MWVQQGDETQIHTYKKQGFFTFNYAEEERLERQYNSQSLQNTQT